MKKAFLVVNPIAGGSPARIQSRLENHFNRAGWMYQVHRLSERESIRRVVRGALVENGESFDLVLAAGGDGTVSGVAAGVVGSEIPLAIVPIGTGNVLARELEIPMDFQRALQLATGSQDRRRIDGLQVDERIFVLNVSVGLSAVVMKNTHHAEKRRLGRAAYLWTGLKKLLGFQPHHFAVLIDGVESGWKASEVIIANSGAIGDPSLRLHSQVALDDGRIDVSILRARSLMDYLRAGWAVLRGKQRQEPDLQHLVAQGSVEVFTEADLPVQGDGDFIGFPPVRVEVLPGVVHVIVPEKEDEEDFDLGDVINLGDG